jgi:hypothetical protein
MSKEKVVTVTVLDLIEHPDQVVQMIGTYSSTPNAIADGVQTVKKLKAAIADHIAKIEKHPLQNRTDLLNYQEKLKQLKDGFENLEKMRKDLNRPYSDSVANNNAFFKREFQTEVLDSLFKAGKNKLASAEQAIKAKEAEDARKANEEAQRKARELQQKADLTTDLSFYVQSLGNQIKDSKTSAELQLVATTLKTMPAKYAPIADTYEKLIVQLKDAGRAQLAQIKSGVFDTKQTEAIIQQVSEITEEEVEVANDKMSEATIQQAVVSVTPEVKDVAKARYVWMWAIEKTANEVGRQFLDVSEDKIQGFITANKVNLEEGTVVQGIRFFKEKRNVI